MVVYDQEQNSCLPLLKHRNHLNYHTIEGAMAVAIRNEAEFLGITAYLIDVHEQYLHQSQPLTGGLYTR